MNESQKIRQPHPQPDSSQSAVDAIKLIYQRYNRSILSLSWAEQYYYRKNVAGVVLDRKTLEKAQAETEV